MKILLTTTTWLYSTMIRTFPLWGKKNVKVMYDFYYTSHFKYYRRHSSQFSNITYSVFTETILQNWNKVDISDKNISKLEDKYDVKLNELIIYDLAHFKYRTVQFDKERNEEFWRRYFVGAIEYYENLLKNYSPDFIFGEGPHLLGMKILFEVARLHRIPYFSISGSYVENTTAFVYGRTGKNIALEYYFKNYELLTPDDFHKAEALINKVKILKEVPYYQKIYGKKPTLIPKNIHILFNTLIKSINYYIEYNKNPLLTLLELKQDFLKMVLYFRFENYNNYKYIMKNSINDIPDDMYVLFFNHFQPEATTSVWSPYYENQSNVIENIAKSLSGTIKLYIKEHTTDLGSRGKAFYNNLFYYPNVKLINPFMNGFDLIKNSHMVFTITGTVGFESIIMGKPVGVFSNCYYSFFPGVKKISCPEDIPSAINWGLKEFKNDDLLINRFVAAYIKSLYPMKFIVGIDFEDENFFKNQDNLEIFVNGINQFIEDFKRYKWNEYLI